VKNAIINGTVSDKTISGARKASWVYRWTLSNIDRFCMQSEEDAERIKALGADPARVVVTGNCKADQADGRMDEAAKAEVRAWFGFPSGAKVFVAGSTNPGEDAPVLDAFGFARQQHGDVRMIVAPRQIERAAEIVSLAEERGLKISRRSDPASVTGAEDVVILDTFGELARVYGIADVAFVGGSLIPKGCHSILQPIAEGKPVFVGPYTHKARDLVAQAKAFGVGFQVQDGTELGRQLSDILGDAERLADIAARCEKMMKANRGAAQRTAAILVEMYTSSR
jgi:3-deoxy-D-manno-octulosonic-acid transferase